MHDQLEHRVRRALGDIIAAAPEAGDEPDRDFTIIDHRPSRPPYLTVAASILVVGGLVTVGISSLTSRDNPPPTQATTTPATGGRRLLVPPGAYTRGPPLAPTPTAAGLIEAPSGSLFRLSVSDVGGWELTPGADERRINGRTFAAELADGQLGYTTLDECIRISVVQQSTDTVPWSDEATALLEALNVDDTAVNLTLPAGWQSFGSGTAASLLQFSYEATVGGETRTVTLGQMPNAPIAVLPGVGSDVLTATNGADETPAWTTTALDGSIRYLIWDDQGTAVMLTAGDATLRELRRLAAGLRHETVEVDLSQTATPGTLPAAETRDGECGGPSLVVQ